MDQRSERSAEPTWLGAESIDPETFHGGTLWVGQHSGDGDVLVYDPSEGDADGEVVSFYSLSKHRTRCFPRAMVGLQINPLADEEASERALQDYAKRDDLQAAHGDELEADRTAHAERQRDAVIEAHRRYIEGLGLDYEGVERTDGNRKSGRRTKCTSCGIALDDFAHAACSICQGVLCSCGACLCGAPVKGR